MVIRNGNPHELGGVRQRDVLVQWPQIVIGTAPRITEITKATTTAHLVDFTILTNKTKTKLRNIQRYFLCSQDLRKRHCTAEIYFTAALTI